METYSVSNWSAHLNEVRSQQLQKKESARSGIYRPHKSRNRRKESTTTETGSTKSFKDFMELRKQGTWGGNTLLKFIWVRSTFFTRTEVLYQIHAVQTGTQFNIPPQRVPPGQVWHSKEFEYSKAFVSLSSSTSLFCSIHYNFPL